MLTPDEIQNLIDEYVSDDWQGSLADIGVIKGKNVEPLIREVITATLRAVGTKSACVRHAPHAKHNMATFEKYKEDLGQRAKDYVVSCAICTFRLGEDRGFTNGKGRGEMDGKALGREQMLTDITSALERALRRLVEAE